MKLPTEKLEEVEYYECYRRRSSTDKIGRPVVKDIIILHYGEYTKEWKLFGKWTIWTKTIEDRTERFVFYWSRKLADRDEGTYNLERDKEFAELRAQLEAWFEHEFADVYNELCDHEIGYIKS